MRTKFRCVKTRSDQWHFQEQCPDWPLSDFIDTRDIPPTSQLCSKCVDIKARELLADLMRGSIPAVQ
jgi:hypothetical protein